MSTEPTQHGSSQHKSGVPLLPIILFVLAAVGAGAVAQQLLTFTGTQPQQTPDGVRISLGPVVHGKSIGCPRPWLLRLVEGTPVREWLGFQSDLNWSHDAESETLGAVLFFRNHPASSHGMFQGELQDERGWASTVSVLREDQVREGLTLAVLGNGLMSVPVPRRSREFRMTIRDARGKKGSPAVARFTFPNPAYTASPKPTTTQTVRLSSTDRDLSVTLQQLVSGIGPFSPHWQKSPPTEEERSRFLAGRFDPPGEDELPLTVAAFSVTQDGKPTSDWVINSSVVHDPYGNPARFLHYYKPFYANGTCYWFLPMLWTDEGAFNFDLQFVRENNVPAAEELTFTLPIPPARDLPNENLSRTVRGTTVTFEGLSGAGATFRTATGELTLSHPSAFLSIERDLDLLPKLSATTGGAGGRIEVFEPDVNEGADGLRHFRFGLHNGGGRAIAAGTTVTLKFRMLETRNVQFTAEPTLLSRLSERQGP